MKDVVSFCESHKWFVLVSGGEIETTFRNNPLRREVKWRSINPLHKWSSLGVSNNNSQNVILLCVIFLCVLCVYYNGYLWFIKILCGGLQSVPVCLKVLSLCVTI